MSLLFELQSYIFFAVYSFYTVIFRYFCPVMRLRALHCLMRSLSVSHILTGLITLAILPGCVFVMPDRHSSSRNINLTLRHPYEWYGFEGYYGDLSRTETSGYDHMYARIIVRQEGKIVGLREVNLDTGSVTRCELKLDMDNNDPVDLEIWAAHKNVYDINDLGHAVILPSFRSQITPIKEAWRGYKSQIDTDSATITLTHATTAVVLVANDMETSPLKGTRKIISISYAQPNPTSVGIASGEIHRSEMWPMVHHEITLDSDTLAYDILLSPDRPQVIDFALSVSEPDGTIVTSTPWIKADLMPGRATIITGKFMTGIVIPPITIDPEFIGEYNYFIQ